MKFKALFLALLTVLAPATLAMQMPPKPSQEAPKVKTTVKADDQCPVCQEPAKNTPENELKITNCCQNFICASCENGIKENARNIAAQNQTPEQRNLFANQHGFEPRNQLKTLCPLCRKDLDTHDVKLLTQTATSNEIQKLTVIDTNGVEFELSENLSKALLKCESLSTYKDFDTGDIDFSGSNYLDKTFVTKELIIALARFIHCPHKTLFLPIIEYDAEGIPFDLELFELAIFLGAPEKVLFVLANEMWPYMQDEALLSKSQNIYKKQLRTLAEPYLSCPDYLLTYIMDNKIDIKKTNIFRTDPNHKGITLDLSHKTCKKITPDISLVANSYLKKYRFITLRGLDKLAKFLRHNEVDFFNIDISDHKLETFSTKQLASIARHRPLTIILKNNNITHVSKKELDITALSDLPYLLFLYGNPIQSIDDSFFETIGNLRAQTDYGNYMHYFNFKNNALSPEKQKEYAKKFYNATHTLPERFASSDTYAYGSMGVGGIMGALLSAYTASSYTQNNTIIGTLGLAGGLVGSAAGHYAMGYVLSKLAQKSHPQVINFDLAMIEGGQRYELELENDNPVLAHPNVYYSNIAFA